MSLSSAIFFSESFEQNTTLLSEFEFQNLRMRPGAAPTIANLERKAFSKALMRNPLGESYTGARGKVTYEVNAVHVNDIKPFFMTFPVLSPILNKKMIYLPA